MRMFQVKRWLKRNGGRFIVVLLGVLYIAWGIYVIISASSPGIVVVVNSALIAAWVFIILLVTGVLNRLRAWWERD